MYLYMTLHFKKFTGTWFQAEAILLFLMRVTHVNDTEAF